LSAAKPKPYGQPSYISRQRRADEVNPELTAGTSEGLGLLRCGRSRRIRETVPFSGSSEGTDEVLELAFGDGEHASFSRLDPIGVGDALGGQQGFTSAGETLLVAHTVTNLTLKHMEDFILVMVDM
jgi:hypothetical protein